MPIARVPCCTTAPFSFAAPIALQLAARHRSRIICRTWGHRSLDAACRPLHVGCHMLSVASRNLHAAALRARSRRRQLCTRARVQALTPLSVWRWAMRWSGFSVVRSHTALVSAAAHTAHSSCTASIAAEQCRLAARADRREGAACGRDGEEPGCLVHRASPSLQGTPQRRRWALVARMLHRHFTVRRRMGTRSARFICVC